MADEIDGVPPFAYDVSGIEAIRATARYLEDENIAPFAFQARQIQAFGGTEEVKAALRITSFSLDRQRWWDFARSGSTRKTVGRNLDALAVAWYWFHRKFPAIIGRFVRENGSVAAAPNPFVSSLHQWLSPDQLFPHAPLRLLSGRYAVYRPHFLDSDQIMVMAMTCGIEDDPSRFEIRMNYPRLGWEEPVNETVDGFMVPYHDCILFQGTIGKPRAPFIFILTDLRPGPDGHYERGEGALLVGAGGTLPNAAPLAIWRTERNLDLRVEPKATIGVSLDYWPYIEAIFERGVVDGGSRRSTLSSASSSA